VQILQRRNLSVGIDGYAVDQMIGFALQIEIAHEIIQSLIIRVKGIDKSADIHVAGFARPDKRRNAALAHSLTQHKHLVIVHGQSVVIRSFDSVQSHRFFLGRAPDKSRALVIEI